jgi:ammonium transporter, Amt family
MGALLTGLLATKEVNGNLKDDLLASLFRSQLSAVGLTIVLACVATAVIALAIKGVFGLRASPEVESTGLDISEHGEEAYII